MTRVEEYQNYYKNYIKKYGNKTVVLMQNCSFYEKYRNKTITLMQNGSFYDIIATDKQIKYVTNICKLLKLQCIYRDNNYLVCFPKICSEKYINILKKNHYNIVIVDQKSICPTTREESCIYLHKKYYLECLNS